jgi:hypothetical protein
MPRIPDGGCLIRASELQDAAYTSQLTYHILKERGAPIMGMCILLLDPAYKWFVEPEDEGMTLIYRWEYIG